MSKLIKIDADYKKWYRRCRQKVSHESDKSIYKSQ